MFLPLSEKGACLSELVVENGVAAGTVFVLGDFAYLIAASAAVALVWGPLRTLLVWRALRATAAAGPNGPSTVTMAVATSNA